MHKYECKSPVCKQQIFGLIFIFRWLSLFKLRDLNFLLTVFINNLIMIFVLIHVWSRLLNSIIRQLRIYLENRFRNGYGNLWLFNLKINKSFFFLNLSVFIVDRYILNTKKLWFINIQWHCFSSILCLTSSHL